MMSDMLLDFIWHARAAEFIAMDFALPQTSGLEVNFWKRFSFSKDAKLYHANSNSQAMSIPESRRIKQVWLYDAHHDCGYLGPKESVHKVFQNKNVTCEDWMIGYGRIYGAELHMRYPKWRSYAMTAEPTPAVTVDRAVDDERKLKVKFDAVFVCKSESWVPSWLDEYYYKFIDACPLQPALNMDGNSNRMFDMAIVNPLAAQIRGAMEECQLINEGNDGTIPSMPGSITDACNTEKEDQYE